ncbi:MAG: hypothetical protein B7733_21810 [Myxococcales bacterium FL481]|nr:MAG: hypothetical protein B7733_21810 [Myxococcales bacterium FL481]
MEEDVTQLTCPSLDESRLVGGEYGFEARYCAYYCEENIWQLCERLRSRCDRAAVCVVSSRQQRVAMWRQQAAAAAGLPVVWDYHVVMACRRPAQRWEIIDLDSLLPRPVDAVAYLDATFPRGHRVPAELTPMFRWIDAEQYRDILRSDRRHMRDAEGRFRRPPPPWPAIGQQGTRGSNLALLTDMSQQTVGELVDLATLRRLVG